MEIPTKPMEITSTPLISYHEITTNEDDLFEDAWGFNSEFSDVIELLGKLKPSPGKRLTKKLIDKIRNEN